MSRIGGDRAHRAVGGNAAPDRPADAARSSADTGSTRAPPIERIALVGEIGADAARALAVVAPVETFDRADAVDPLRHEVAALDARGSDAPAGDGAARALRAALEVLAPQPCVVLVVVDAADLDDDAASAEAAASLGERFELADELASAAEIGTATFRWRLARHVARLRRPLALSRRWQAERTVLEAIADHSSDWIFVKDLEHRFLLAGIGFARTVGRPLETIIGRDDLQIGSSRPSVLGDSESGWPGFWPQDDAALRGEAPLLEYNPDWQMFSESPRHKRTLRVPLRNARGEPYALLVCSSDVTRVVRAESELARDRGRLDAESRARREAERAASEKMRFLAAATHDLRQPLHAGGLFIEALERRLETDEQRAVLERIRRSNAALAALFDALLDISRLDAALVEVHVREVPLGTVLEGLRDEFVAEGKAKGLIVRIPPSALVVRTDPVLLGRILRNLLHNAVRYTERGEVALECVARGTRCELRVRDSGPGIAPAEHDAVFGEFYRVGESGGRDAQGLGLGLAICRRTARLLGTELTLDSSPGAGATFALHLPLGVAARATRHGRGPRPRLDGRVIVVIDDEREVLDGTGAVYRSEGCRTVLAIDVHEALATLERRALRADVVVADHRSGNEASGIRAIERIRRHHARQVPGLIVTGDTDPRRVLDARCSGVALLHKPVAPADLVRAVAELLGKGSG